VQDAVTGQMLSADPTIPDPSNAQSYNRYSYVNDNPLTLIDPSGFDPCPEKCAIPIVTVWGSAPFTAPDGGGGGSGSSDSGKQTQLETVTVFGHKIASKVGTAVNIAQIVNETANTVSHAWKGAVGKVLGKALGWTANAATVAKALTSGSWLGFLQEIGAAIINDGTGAVAGSLTQSPLVGVTVSTTMNDAGVGQTLMDPTPGPLLVPSYNPDYQEQDMLDQCVENGACEVAH
jgi:hypothetical protein